MGLVDSYFEVYWLEVVLRRKSPLSFLCVEVEIYDWRDETATEYCLLYPPKEVALGVSGLSEEQSCSVIERCRKRGLLPPMYYIFRNKEGATKEERGRAIRLRQTVQTPPPEDAEKEAEIQRRCKLRLRGKDVGRPSVAVDGCYSPRWNCARVRKKLTPSGYQATCGRLTTPLGSRFFSP